MAAPESSYMSIVIDMSVLLAVAANEPTKLRLIAMTQGADLIGPRTIPWEVGNALSAMCKRKRLTADQAMGAIREYRRIAVRLVEVPLEDSVRLAATLGIYAYDAYIIQCARMSGQPLLTLDAPLRHAAQRAGVRILET
jgi:predicted nucleic acid-binding protein